MNSSDAVSKSEDIAGESKIPDGVTSAMEALAPSAARRFGSGNFAAVAGVVSLYRALKSFRKGDRKRGLVRAGVGLFWVGVVLARRRKSGSGGPDAADVVSTGPDVEGAVEPGERETDHATGSEVVSTTDADIEESDTAPEVETATDIDTDAAEDVDQRDVTGTDEVEAIDESSEDDETGVPDSQSEIETGNDASSEGDASETDTEDAESESAE